MTTNTLKITGMTCGHCSQAVTRALAAVAGVTAVQVSLEKGEARIEGDADPGQLIRAVRSEGYGAEADAGPGR
jgi:copper chaperone